MKELLKYHAKVYFRSSKIIMPFLFWLIFLRISYSQKPLEYLPNIVMSAGVLFFVITWVGYSYMDLEDSISEQLMILKVHNMNLYNASKIVFLLSIGLLMSIIGIAFPVLQNVFLSNSLFKRELVLSDVTGGVLLHCATAFLGALIGALVHPRIIKNRKIAVLLALAITLVGYTTGVLKSHFPVTQFILWIFPPVYQILESFNGKEYFSIRNMALPLFYAGIYCSILMAVQLQLLKRIKF